ncbi:MAG: hypothetical protein ACREUX_09220 [Burkholderiales bacterium]
MDRGLPRRRARGRQAARGRCVDRWGNLRCRCSGAQQLSGTPKRTFESARYANLFVFDLLYADGIDLRGAALIDRKRALQQLLVDASPTIQYSDHFAAPGPKFFKSACKLGLEGMVSRRAGRVFQSGRSSDWLKVKCVRRQEFVIGGFRTGRGTLRRPPPSSRNCGSERRLLKANMTLKRPIHPALFLGMTVA